MLEENNSVRTKEAEIFLKLINKETIIETDSDAKNARKNYDIWQKISTSQLIPDEKSSASLLKLLQNPENQSRDKDLAILTRNIFRNAPLFKMHNDGKTITSLDTALLEGIPSFINLFNKIKNANSDLLNSAEGIQTLKDNLDKIKSSLQYFKKIQFKFNLNDDEVPTIEEGDSNKKKNKKRNAYIKSIKVALNFDETTDILSSILDHYHQGIKKDKIINNQTLKPAYLMMCCMAFIQKNAIYFEQAIQKLEQKIKKIESQPAVTEKKKTKETIPQERSNPPPVIEVKKNENILNAVVQEKSSSKNITLVTKTVNEPYIPNVTILNSKTDNHNKEYGTNTDDKLKDLKLSHSFKNNKEYGTNTDDKLKDLKLSHSFKNNKEYGTNTDDKLIYPSFENKTELVQEETNQTTQGDITIDNSISTIIDKNYNNNIESRNDDKLKEESDKNKDRIPKVILLSALIFIASFALCYFGFDLNIFFTLGISISVTGTSSIIGYNFLFRDKTRQNFKIKNSNNISNQDAKEIKKQKSSIIKKKDQLHSIDMNNSLILNLKNNKKNQIYY